MSELSLYVLSPTYRENTSPDIVRKSSLNALPLELARSLSSRAQQLLGFRSFGDNTWLVNHHQLAHFLELD